MPMDAKEFKRRVTEHFENVTEEEFLKNLQKSSPYLFTKESREPENLHSKIKANLENEAHTKNDSQNLIVSHVGSGYESFLDTKADNSVEVKDNISQGLSYWKHNDKLSCQVREEISLANVLFIPFQLNEGGVPKSLFARDTEAFVDYLRRSGKDDIRVDLCANDNEYHTLGLYSDPVALTSIGTIVISLIIAPVIKDLILDYIRSLNRKSEQDSIFQINIVIDDELGSIREIQCSGSSVEIEKILPSIFDSVLNYTENIDDSTIKKMDDGKKFSD
jgi:hypothetical protein